MSAFVHIEPADAQRRAFARWCLAQTPKLQTASSTGTDVPVDLYPEVPPELLEGAFVDGYLYGGTAAPAVAEKQPEDPRDPEPPKPPQVAADAPAPKPRKRSPRKPRKTAASRLTAETVAGIAAASEGPDSSDG